MQLSRTSVARTDDQQLDQSVFEDRDELKSVNLQKIILIARKL